MIALFPRLDQIDPVPFTINRWFEMKPLADWTERTSFLRMIFSKPPLTHFTHQRLIVIRSPTAESPMNSIIFESIPAWTGAGAGACPYASIVVIGGCGG